MRSILISELKSTIDPNGALTVPMDVIEQMGLHPGDSIYIAYLADDKEQNLYREFLLAPHTIDDDTEDSVSLSIPTQLLADAHIPENADVQIICIDGAIILCRDFHLQTDALFAVLQDLNEAGNLSSELPGDIDTAIELLQECIGDAEGGMIDDAE